MSTLSDKINQNIRDILLQYRHVAVVGVSEKPMRPSHQVAEYLLNNGYRIFPVNPMYKQVLGLECYPDLKHLPQKVDIVDIFRRPEDVLPIVEDAITIGAKVVWMQLGVVNEEAAQRALDAGLQVVMDRCIKIEHTRLFY